MAANSIELGVDRSTFDRWSNALGNLLVLRVASVHPAGTFPLSPPLPEEVRFTGLRLLLQIGRACSRPEVVDDPSRLFGLLKYATSLASGTPMLSPGGSRVKSFSLVAGIETLDRHKKAVLSDEFGCGMAFEFCRQVLGAVFYLDVDTAIRRNWLQTAAARSRRPDYLAVCLSGAQPWIVLEAKGSQSGDGYCRERQVTDGCDQLSNVQLVGGGVGNPLLLVVATALYREDQRNISGLFVGDPEPNDAEPYQFLNQEAAETVVRSHYLRIATLTGDRQLANRMSTGEDTDANDDALVFEELGGRKFAGSRVVFNATGSSMETFVGLDVFVRSELLRGNLVGVARRLGQGTIGDETALGRRQELPEKGSAGAELENDGTALLLKRHGRAVETD